MVESVVHPFVGPKLEELKILDPELIQETTKKIVQIKQRMQAARDRQKSYADLKCEPMKFQVGDKVMLKVSPWKGVVRFGKRRNLNLRVHNTFHVSNLKKYHADEPLSVPLDGLHFDDKLHFVEKPVEIVDREVKRLKQSQIPLAKVRWNSKRGPEFTWEREDQFQKKYPHLFARTASSSKKPLLKDSDGEDVDVHTYRSMIGSLMYLTSSRPDIMFAVCACARFQVTLKVSHLNAVKRIFRYLKGKPYLGLWYPKDSPFDLVAYSDSDYAGASLDRKSTTRGCQFFGCRLIKQTVVATSSTEAEYVAAASGCAQVLWIQNQLLDYGYNFMYTVIYIDNSSTICIIKNPVLHSKTKHIEIRHHFIRDCNEKKLIQTVKIPTENNFADLLTKAFDVGRFQYLVASIGLLNP
nr:putative ribonuclease H-like domain-containing protein [Tanacetum cinerariifolium]